MIQVGVVMRKVFCTGGLLMALLPVSGCAAGGAKVEGKVGVVDPARVSTLMPAQYARIGYWKPRMCRVSCTSAVVSTAR